MYPLLMSLLSFLLSSECKRAHRWNIQTMAGGGLFKWLFIHKLVNLFKLIRLCTVP